LIDIRKFYLCVIQMDLNICGCNMKFCNKWSGTWTYCLALFSVSCMCDDDWEMCA
jgi:hypothetical protein